MRACTPHDMRAYDEIADWYAAARRPEVGAAEIEALARRLAPGAPVLDLGCGTGHPIATCLTERGFQVTGIDSSSAMVARFRENVPGAEARCERIQDAHIPHDRFAAIVAWGVLFHLSDADQEQILECAAAGLAPGGVLLFTSGDVEGWAEGEMNGVTFRYRSLGERRYRALLERRGFAVEAVHADAWGNHVYLSQKDGTRPG